MYKVAAIALSVLFVVALVCSFLGLVVYSPLEMIASLLVLGFSVWLTSLVFAVLFRIRAHSESSFITALILFFVLSPTVELSGLVALGLVGAIAGASKFILAYQGRHIFNPVAIAAVIAGLTGITSASWWVGTPLLVIPTVLLGAAILIKTRRLALAGTFAAIAMVLVFIQLLNGGQTPSESAVLLLSWPILFFASFMLTEPLTLPGKKWQQITEAGIVAIIFAVPFGIGDFSTTPALALVMGNLLAFGFMRRQKIVLTFQEKKQMTHNTFEFIFAPQKPQVFQPGQYIEITVPHAKDDLRGSRRSFSVTSVPGQDELSLGIKFYEPSSTFKKALMGLEKGMVVQATGISGDFTLPKDPSLPLLFIAGGIGITPFVGQLRALEQRNEKRDIVVLYMVASDADVAYHQYLQETGSKVLVMTHPGKTLQDLVPDIAKRAVYISGPPAMVDSFKAQAKKLNVQKIKTDYFIGY